MRAADPDRKIVALSGDYDFQFLIEELAVGAQHKLPYLHVVVNNAYLGLIRQAQRGFEMDFEVSLAFDNINAPRSEGYGVDHVTVAEGLGCKAIRVQQPEEFAAAFAQARALMEELQVPVVIEFILERVTNIVDGHRDRQRRRVRGDPLPRSFADPGRRLRFGAAQAADRIPARPAKGASARIDARMHGTRGGALEQ